MFTHLSNSITFLPTIFVLGDFDALYADLLVSGWWQCHGLYTLWWHRNYSALIQWGYSQCSPPRGRSLRWRHNDHDGVSDHQPHDCLLNRLFWRISKKTSKLSVTGLCAGTSEFPAQMASNAEKVSIWWRHHVTSVVCNPSQYDKTLWVLFTEHREGP